LACVAGSKSVAVMRETVILSSLVIKITLLMTVSSHEAVNPLTRNAGSQHEHHHQPPKQQQQPQHDQVHPAAQHRHSAHGIDRNSVQNQQ